MILSGDIRYIKVAFNDESEIENVVKGNSELLFGPYAMFLPKTRISTLGRTDTIPDGIVIDLRLEEWYLVEAERASHGTWEHIAPQVSKALTGTSHEETHAKLIRVALDLARSDTRLQEILRDLDIEEMDLHGKIARILKKAPQIAIPIDEIPADLREWTKTLKHIVRIWRLEKYVKLGGNEILYFIPDDAIPDVGSQLTNETGTPVLYGSDAYGQLVKHGVLKLGQQLVMDYAPKGMSKQQFIAVVREDGLEVEGKVYSPSAAAVACMRKAGSYRQSADGWLHWKTTDGMTIGKLRQRFSGPGTQAN